MAHKSRVTASGRVLATTSIGDDANQEPYEFVFDIEAIREVLEVGKNGRATKIALTVRKSSREWSMSGGKAELAPRGSVVIVSSATGKVDIQTEDPNAPISRVDKLLFKFAADLMGMDATLGIGDAAYGTDKPRRVGESWPVNGEAIAKCLTEAVGQKAPFSKEGITGRVTLAGVKKVHGIECLELRAEVSAKTVAPVAIESVVASAVGGEAKSSMTVYLPLDPSIPVLGGNRKSVTTINMTWKSPLTGEDVLSKTKTNDTVTLNIVPFSDDAAAVPE